MNCIKMRVALGTTALILLQSSHGFTTPLRSSNDKKSIFPAWANKKAPFQKAQEVDLGGDDDPDDLKSAVKAAVRKASLMEKISDKAIPVRFVNFDPKNPLRQLVAYVPEGKNLLKIGDVSFVSRESSFGGTLTPLCMRDRKRGSISRVNAGRVCAGRVPLMSKTRTGSKKGRDKGIKPFARVRQGLWYRLAARKWWSICIGC